MKSRSEIAPEGASFRDPSGFVFYHEGTPHRQINQFYREDYRQLTDSGLYRELALSAAGEALTGVGSRDSPWPEDPQD